MEKIPVHKPESGDDIWSLYLSPGQLDSRHLIDVQKRRRAVAMGTRRRAFFSPFFSFFFCMCVCVGGSNW